MDFEERLGPTPPHPNGNESAPRVPKVAANLVGITTQPHPLLWTACVLLQVGLLACRRLGAGGWCAQPKKHVTYHPLLWTACVLPQVGLLACRRLAAVPFPPPPGTACVPEAGGRGVVCAARKARNLPPSPLDCLCPAAGWGQGGGVRSQKST